MDLSLTLLIGGAAVLVGGIVQGCIGFGFGMVALTPLLFLMDQRAAVPTLMMLSLLNTVPIAVSNRDKIRFGIVAPLAAGALLGIPLGLVANLTVDATLFRAIVGGILLAFALILATGWRRPLPKPHLASLPVGFVSGIMTGSMSMGGPPVIMFFANQDVPKDTFRTNIVTYFSCVELMAITMASTRGMVTAPVLLQTAAFAPLLVGGTWMGARVSRHVSEDLFRKLTLACVGGMGLIMTLRSLAPLSN